MMSRDFTPEQDLIDKFIMGNAIAFEELSRRYIYPLYSYCLDKLNSPEDAKRIVRTIFISLWEKRDELPLDFSVSIYLYTEVRRSVVQCLNNKLNTNSDIPVIEEEILPAFSATELIKARQPIKDSFQIKSVDLSFRHGKGKYEDLIRWNKYSPVVKLKELGHTLQDMLHLS
jgi:DNA-directed RNA polymerase specialized sigma24 family protein